MLTVPDSGELRHSAHSSLLWVLRATCDVAARRVGSWLQA